jgi:hypothetical protein
VKAELRVRRRAQESLLTVVPGRRNPVKPPQ